MKGNNIGFFLSFVKMCFRAAAHLPLVVGLLWTMGLCVCRPVCSLLLLPAIFILIKLKTKYQQAFPLRASLVGIILLAVAGFALLSAPSDMKWEKPWAHAPQATIDGDKLHLRYVRDFEFYTAKTYDIRYLEEDYDLTELCGVHLIESRHHALFDDCDLLFSFVFSDGRCLVFAPEMRLPLGETYNDTQAFYKCYGLLYLFGTEEDMLRRRTNLNREYLSLHTLRVTQEQAQHMLAECVQLVTAAAGQKDEAYPPFQGRYSHAMQRILRTVAPHLSYCLNEDIAHKLFEQDLLVSREGELWAAYQRRCAVGFNPAADDRQAYGSAIRRISGAPRLPSLRVERHVQEEQLATMPKREAILRGKVTVAQETKPQAEPQTRFTTGKGKALAAEIPEPTTRLTADTREHAQEEPQPEQEEQQPAPPANNASSSILEPRARMEAEAKAEAAAAAKKERERKNAEQGRFRQEAEGEEEPVTDMDYNAVLLGRKSSGIKIIEKKKPKEAPHPLDPYKRINPFDEEDQAKEDAENEEDDLTAPPKEIHF